MFPIQTYVLAPSYEENSCRCIGVLQQLQTLLRRDATLADVSQMIQCFQEEFGKQEQLEHVIQSLVGRFLATQITTRKHNASVQNAQVSCPANLSGSVSGRSALLETLTPQERRVLRLLAAGRSNQDIAHELVVSLNTVKTHMKNLYSKLQVSSRTQALALARDLHVL